MKNKFLFAAMLFVALSFGFVSCDNEPVVSDYNGYGYVDLGLSVKWATCNVGAGSPEDYGDYFAWGETKPKLSYTEENYTYTDNPETLSSIRDAASVNMGGSWRMPTKGEWMELQEECTWEWKQSYKGTTAGYLVTSKANGNSIFFPAAGYRGNSGLDGAGSLGDYWSSSLDAYNSDGAYGLHFSSGSVSWGSDYRYFGESVRGVFSK